jgi:hypothetical protein
MAHPSPRTVARATRRRRYRRALVLGVLLGSLLACDAWAGPWDSSTLGAQALFHSE